MLSNLWLLFAIPAASAAILLLANRRATKWGPWLGVIAPAISFVLGLIMFFQLADRNPRLAEQNRRACRRNGEEQPDIRKHVVLSTSAGSRHRRWQSAESGRST